MKKQFFILVIVALMGVLASCEKNEDIVPQEQSKEVPKFEVSNPSSKSLQNVYLDEQDIADYANTWWNGTNSPYPRYTNDCASFSSQCLEAGGLNQVSGVWYFSQSNPTLNWNNADHLYDYLVANYRTTKATFYKSDDSYYQSIKGLLELGSLIFYDYDGDNDWDHVMVICGSQSGHPKVAGHTADENKRMDWTIYYNSNMTSSGKAKYVKVGY